MKLYSTTIISRFQKLQPKPNMMWIGWTVVEVWPFEICRDTKSASCQQYSISIYYCQYIRNHVPTTD